METDVVYETKSKIIRHRQETYVLFTGSDLKDLKFQIQKFFYRQMYMSLATNKFFIVVTGNIKKDPKKVAKSVQLFMWYRHKLSNILVLIPNFNVSTLDVYTWLPFSSETQCNRQLDVVRVSQMTCDNFKHNSNEYLNDVSQNHKSFHGCAISVYTFVEDYVMTPHNSVDEIFYRENYETVLLKIILRKLNLSYEFMPYLERKFHPFALNVCMVAPHDVVVFISRVYKFWHTIRLVANKRAGCAKTAAMETDVVYETKSKIIRHRQETYVLFTGSDLKDLKFQIQKFFYRQMYMSLATNKFFIVVTGNVKKDPKKVAESVQLFMWYRHKLSNILVLIPNFNVSTLDVYTWLPFSSETQCNRQLDVVRVSQMTCDNFKHNSNEYLMDVSQNHKSFHGCAISVYTFVEDYVMTPHNSVDEVFYRENYETVLLKIILQKLNLSYEFMPYLERKFHPFALNVCMDPGKEEQISTFDQILNSELNITSHRNSIELILSNSGDEKFEGLKERVQNCDYYRKCFHRIDVFKDVTYFTKNEYYTFF
ncbi:hypothetical protein ANN_10343 [Periplaneta americana]|uniref:Uncharacterized protein n=1 Tax=Periplaneta americana TaxID=6978 RepID=A0ABQ8TPU3_PERAM|nr:hypothetical protein ANN_10343 [Periplaneta americana]